MLKSSRALAALGSTTLTLVILAVFAVAIAVATFIETAAGTAGARVLVYNAWWFEALLGLFIVNNTVSLVIHMPYKVRQTGFVITHIGFIVVLLSAGITRYFGYEGLMPIREGSSTDYMYSAEKHVMIDTDGQFESYPIRLYKSGDMSARRNVSVGGESFRVAVTEYFAHYETRVEESPGGSPVVVLSASGVGEDVVLKQGGHLDAGGVHIDFLETDPQEQPGNGAYGALVIGIDGETSRLAVPKTPPVETTAGGYRFQITEFNPSFRVGGTVDPDAPMNNPAIRVEVTSPDGTTQKKLLFALHPDFDMGHSGGESAELPVELTYEYEQKLVLVRDGDALMARASFNVDMTGHDTNHEATRIPAGERFTLPMNSTIRSGQFGMIPTQVWASGTEKPFHSADANRPAAVRMVVEDSAGNRDETIAVEFEDIKPVTLGERKVLVGYGPVKVQLPYRLHLDDFKLVSYPGSTNPASYESHVRVYDDTRGVNGTPVRIYMNHPLTYRGYKHFQSSYDRDLRGTILSVNHDPGKRPTYFGYILVGLGFLITLTRGIWLRKGNGAVRKQSARAAAGIAVGLLCMGTALFAQAQTSQEDPHAGHDHSQMQVPPPNYLSDSAREALSRLMVQDYQGRMKPLDTLARESVMKITKKHAFKGWEPVDMYLSWMTHSQYWFEQPIIAVRNPDLKKLLGLNPETTHVTPSSLLDADGRYRLTDDVQRVHRTADKDRKKVDRKLLSFDERVNLFNMAIQGRTLRIYPVPNDANNTWISPGEFGGEEAAAVDQNTMQQYQNAFQNLYGGLGDLDSGAVLHSAQVIGGIQYTYGASVIPSEGARRAEMTLNRLQPFTWVTVPYLFAFIVLMLAYGWSLARLKGGRLSLRNPLYALGMLLFLGSVIYHTYAYVLRWRAAGHAPLSNGYESLIFISVAIAVVGLYYELRERRGSIGALASMFTAFILGVAMLPTFDPAISPLVPVLASAWLIIHVTVITASYGFLGLAAVMALTMLVLHMFKGPNRLTLRHAIADMHRLHWNVLIAGLAFLSVGTFLGGVWANESWGRYWGWDPKETWSLVTILVYAFVIHFRFIEKLNRPIYFAAGSFLSIWSIAMTYFGVNYFLSGLHSYAQGDAPGVPGWVYVTAVIMALIVVAAIAVDRAKTWGMPAKSA